MYYVTKYGTVYETRGLFFKRIEEKINEKIVPNQKTKVTEKQIAWAKRIAIKNLSVILNYADDRQFCSEKESKSLKTCVLAIPTYINNPLYWIDNVEMNEKFKHELSLCKIVCDKDYDIKESLSRIIK